MAKTYTTDEDRQVARQFRVARAIAGMSQEKFGEEIGLTFQQIQKYEKGINRISAGRVKQAARIFGLPVEFFFRDNVLETVGPQSGIDDLTVSMLSRDGLDLNRAFAKIADEKVRKRVVNLVRALSEEVEVREAA